MINFRDLKGDRALPRKYGDADRGAGEQESELSFRHFSFDDDEKVEETPTAVPGIQPDKGRETLYEEAHVYLNQVFLAVRNQQRFDLEWGVNIMKEIVEFQSPKDTLLINAIHSETLYNYVVRHSVNVAIFSTIMANSLSLNKEKIIEVGLVGLLHDVGMGLIPEEIIYKRERLTDREYEIMKERSSYSYKILQKYHDQHPYLPECAFQVYERVDGSGYPKGLKEDEIHEYAQIVGLAAVYEALIHSRPQREKFPHFAAAKEIIKTGKKSFQREHLKALLNIFSIFPLESHVKLNSGAIGKVIDTFSDQPMRPKLQILYDSQNRKVLTERIINLPDNPLLYIVDAVSEDELESVEQVAGSGKQSKKEPKTDEDVQSFGMQMHESGDAEQIVEEVEERIESSGEVLKPKRGKWIVFICLVLFATYITFWLLGPRNNSVKVKKVNAKDKESTTIISRKIVKPVQSGEAVLQERPSYTQNNKNTESRIDIQSDINEELDLTVKPSEKPPVNETPQFSFIEDTGSNKMNVAETIPDMLAVEVPEKIFETSPTALENQGISIVQNPDSKIASDTYPVSIKLTYFKTQEEAEASLASFREKGIDAFWVKVNLGEEGIWYRIFTGFFENMERAQGFINSRELVGAVPKRTRFAALIGSYSDSSEAETNKELIKSKGYNPYIIEKEDNRFYLYVGAFYTRKGAEEQSAELGESDIANSVVER